MNVLCKFKCDAKLETAHGFELSFSPVTASRSENTQFFEHTPYGELKFGTINSKAADQFEVGGEYYLNLSASA